MKKLLLIGIILLAFVLRFWKLNTFPAFNADEAAIGYNAYSLLETGKDEHSNPWPIHFQSFNDYKPGLYVYLVMPFVKVLGLNEWAVRIPNAALGVATVYLVYLLVEELFGSKKWLMVNGQLLKKVNKSSTINHQLLAIIASFFLAISPWHIHFSRGGWEVNTATFFIIAGLLFFLRRSQSTIYYLLSTVFFVLSLYTYHAARIVTPLLIFGLLGIYFQDFRENFRKYLLSALFACVLLLPLVKDMLKPAISSRAAGVGLFADSGPLNRINEERGEHPNYNSITTKLLHNKAVNYSLAFLENWGAHYHGLFLFISGDDIQRDKVPETGQMYMLDALWIVVGVCWMAKNWNKSIRLIIHWLLIAPVAAALTFQSPHALRSENMVIPLIIIASIGFVYVWNWFSARSKYLLVIGHWSLVILVLLQFARYEHMYYTHMSKEYPYSSQYGVKELISYIKENESKFDKVVVTDRYDQPYILFLFYQKYPPALFQNNDELTGRDKFGFSTVSHWDKYIFTSIDWNSVRLEYPNSMIAGTKEEILQTANIVKRVYGTNGFEYFDVVVN